VTEPNEESTRAVAEPRPSALGSHGGAFGAPEWGIVALIAGIWGSSFLFIAIGIEGLSPGLVVFLRILFGALTLVWFPKARAPIPRSSWPRIATMGVIWMALPFLLFPIAEQWVSSSVAGMINGSMPVFAAIVVGVRTHHVPRGTAAAGIVVGFCGVVAVSLPELSGADASPLGVVLILAAVICYAVGATIASPLQQEHGAMPVVLRAQLVALAVSAPLAAAGVASSSFAWQSVAAMVPLGVLSSGVAFVALVFLVGRVGADRGSIGIYFVPIVAIILGVVFRGEKVAPVQIAGTALVVAGAWLAGRARH